MNTETDTQSTATNSPSAKGGSASGGNSSPSDLSNAKGREKRGTDETTPFDFFRKNTQLFFDTYNRQFDLGLEIYTQWTKSLLQDQTKIINRSQIEFLEKGMNSMYNHFSKTIHTSKDMVQKIVSNWLPQTGKPISDNTNDTLKSILRIYREQARISTEFNQRFLETVTKDFSIPENGFNLASEKLTRNLQATIEKSEETMKCLIEQYSTDTTNSLKNADAFSSKINTFFDDLAKANMALWEELKKTLAVKKTLVNNVSVHND